LGLYLVKQIMGRMENDGWIGTFPFLGMKEKEDQKRKRTGVSHRVHVPLSSQKWEESIGKRGNDKRHYVFTYLSTG
jgi:hypothetical protein